MNTQAIFIYCLCADTLEALNFHDDKQCKMSSAEVMTFVIISALHYQCNYRKTRLVTNSLKYFPKILSHSQLIRRIHKVPTHIWVFAFQICKEVLGGKNHREFIVDSFPVAASRICSDSLFSIFSALIIEQGLIELRFVEQPTPIPNISTAYYRDRLSYGKGEEYIWKNSNLRWWRNTFSLKFAYLKKL